MLHLRFFAPRGIGKVLELGRSVYPRQRYVPILVGVPALKRYTLFGHHFAAAGADGGTYRLDRHPTMSRHPITPMRESDLRLHLREQTDLPVSLMEWTALDGVPEEVSARLEHRLEVGEPAALLFDVIDDPRLEAAGRLMWREAEERGTGLFVIGSSGVEYALAAHWAKEGLVDPGGRGCKRRNKRINCWSSREAVRRSRNRRSRGRLSEVTPAYGCGRGIGSNRGGRTRRDGRC